VRFILLLSRQGKVRLAKWYTTTSQKERAKIIKEVSSLVLARAVKLCNFIDWKDSKIVYKRYASLYFVAGIDQGRSVRSGVKLGQR
jgi:AP-1 complex subunit sigma 1/2